MKDMVTSFTALPTAEGMRLAFTYSSIDDDGNLVRSNVRHTIIITDDDINASVSDIFEWLNSKIPAKKGE